MFLRFLLAALFIFAVSLPAAAQETSSIRKQLFADLAALEKIARERPLSPADWERFTALEHSAAALIESAETRQAELERSGKAELYRLFVRASRLQAAEKARTLKPEQAEEKTRIDDRIFRLAEPLMTARHEELTAKKESGAELTMREMAILDGLTRWRSTAATTAVEPVDELNAPRMDLRQLIWIEQIAIMEEQGQVRRDLRVKDQLAEILRWVAQRAENLDGDSRQEVQRRISLMRSKRQ